MKAALLEYGWPDNFRKDDWIRDVGDLEQRFDREWMREMQAKDSEPEIARLNIQDDGPT